MEPRRISVSPAPVPRFELPMALKLMRVQSAFALFTEIPHRESKNGGGSGIQTHDLTQIVISDRFGNHGNAKLARNNLILKTSQKPLFVVVFIRHFAIPVLLRLSRFLRCARRILSGHPKRQDQSKSVFCPKRPSMRHEHRRSKNELQQRRVRAE